MTTFGQWRAETLQALNTQINTNGQHLNYPELIKDQPALRNLGWTQQQGKQLKDLHIGDFAIDLDATRNSRQANNILVEIELSPKTYSGYCSILDTYALELKHSLVFSKIIYFTVGKQVGNLLKRIDTQRELGLFNSGKLIILPLTNREGALVKPNKRITIGA